MTSTNSNRGDFTRDAIVKSATEIFGKTGYDAASTRAISEAAGTNQALISYHFGGKQGLYQAVIETIATEMESSLVPLLDEIETEMPLRGPAAADALMKVFAVLLERLNLEESRAWSRIMAREQQDPTPAFEVIYTRYMSRVLDTLAMLIMGLSEGTVEEASARTQAVLFLGQILVFMFAREATQRFLGWTDLGTEHANTVLHELEQTLYARFPGVK